MRLSIIILASLASIATAVPATDAPDNNCGWPNGNCYDNDCHGELSNDKMTCTSVCPELPYHGYWILY